MTMVTMVVTTLVMVMMTCDDNAIMRSGSSKHLYWEWPLVSSDFLIPATFFYQSDLFTICWPLVSSDFLILLFTSQTFLDNWYLNIDAL